MITIIKSGEAHYVFKETDVMLVNEESCLVNMFNNERKVDVLKGAMHDKI